MGLLNYIDKIYCINLESRPERWEKCKRQFELLGIDSIVERFEATKLSPGIAGCTMSHYQVIKKCKQQNLSNVLIFEDDFEIINYDIDNIVDMAFNQLKLNNLSYDLLYLGGNIRGTELNQKITDNLINIKRCKAAHAYIVNSRIFDIIINYFDNLDWANPVNWYVGNELRSSIDVWYINYIQILENSYAITPCLFNQFDGYSDISDRYIHHDIVSTYKQFT